MESLPVISNMPSTLPKCDDEDDQCPYGGQFYKCTVEPGSKTAFIGCCDSDPCQEGGCSPTDLYSAYFNSFNNDGEGYVCPEGSAFYTCLNVGLGFVGCCGVDAGCESDDVCEDLYPAYHFSVDVHFPGTTTAESLATIQSTTMPSASPTVFLPQPSSSIPSPPTTLASDVQKGKNSGPNAKAIAGSTIGSVAGVLIIGLLMLYTYKKGKRSRRHMDANRTVPSGVDHVPPPPHHGEEPSMLEASQG